MTVSSRSRATIERKSTGGLMHCGHESKQVVWMYGLFPLAEDPCCEDTLRDLLFLQARIAVEGGREGSVKIGRQRRGGTLLKPTNKWFLVHLTSPSINEELVFAHTAAPRSIDDVFEYQIETIRYISPAANKQLSTRVAIVS